MRPYLEALHNAGIQRAGFSAHVQVVDKLRGHVGLQRVQTPIGEIDHAWVPYFHRGKWVPHTGEMIEFTAQIAEYHHTDGTPDIGLFAVKVIR